MQNSPIHMRQVLVVAGLFVASPSCRGLTARARARRPPPARMKVWPHGKRSSPSFSIHKEFVDQMKVWVAGGTACPK